MTLVGYRAMYQLLMRHVGRTAARIGSAVSVWATPIAWYAVTQPAYQHGLAFGLVALLINLPVIVTLVTSFKSPREITGNPSLWIEAPTLTNYVAVLTPSERLNIFGYLGNSLAISLIGSGLALLLALPAAHAIARGGFGSPTFFVGDDMYFGNDRLPLVRDALERAARR